VRFRIVGALKSEMYIHATDQEDLTQLHYNQEKDGRESWIASKRRTKEQYGGRAQRKDKFKNPQEGDKHQVNSKA